MLCDWRIRTESIVGDRDTQGSQTEVNDVRLFCDRRSSLSAVQSGLDLNRGDRRTQTNGGGARAMEMVVLVSGDWLHLSMILWW